MRLFMHKTFSSIEQMAYGRVFHLACEWLGITAYDGSVHLTRERINKPPNITTDGHAAGCMYMRPTSENRRRVRNNQTPKEFAVVLNPDNIHLHPSQMLGGCVEDILSICHELIHVRQMLTGELQVSPDGVPRRYFNVPINVQSFDYKSIPWEAEPHAKMFELATYVTKRMVEEARQEKRKGA